MPGHTIPVSTAEEMIKDYYDYMTKLGVKMDEQTQSVTFSAGPLMDYLNHNLGSADELRIFMGMYPPEHEQAGRTTVILWPYLNGQPLEQDGPMREDTNDHTIEPFNEGHGNP